MARVVLAVNTLRAIDRMIQADQGSAYRGLLGKVLPHVGDAYRQDEDAHRSHMGASVIGHECARHVWYNFRWAHKGNFEGRMLRLFNRGHLEEGRLIAALLMIGCQIYQQDENGKQFRISHAEGHFGGSGDGIALGIPDLAPGQPSQCEFKTHNDKSFTKLAGENWKKYVEHLLDPGKPKVQFDGEGVREAKFEHYVQMQIYMRKMGLAVGLYMAVNKNDDAIYAELVPADTIIADQFLDRGEKLVWMDEPPKKLNESPGFWMCRFCDHRPVCHLKAAPDRNCRSCQYSKPLPNAEWTCLRDNTILDKSKQLAGCEKYEVKRCF
jgi:hypothetical protein